MEDYRAITREVIRIRMKEDKNLFLAEGTNWVGNSKLLSGIIHPNDEGMYRMGTGIATVWKKLHFSPLKFFHIHTAYVIMFFCIKSPC